VSLRRLSGWEPAEVTTFEYDGDRLVRSVTVREGEFDADEVAVLLASRRVEQDMGSHGVPMSEATDPENAGKFVINDRPRVDYVRLAIQAKQDAYYGQYPSAKDEQRAHIWYVKGRDE
jgi:hypothetical protein